MTEARFTPGPWRVSAASDGQMGKPIMASGGHVIGFAIDLPLNEALAAVQKANARLIAAAPELYEALERINDTGDAALDIAWIRRISRAALAKARGDQ
jgi:hypothetical protein